MEKNPAPAGEVEGQLVPAGRVIRVSKAGVSEPESLMSSLGGVVMVFRSSLVQSKGLWTTSRLACSLLKKTFPRSQYTGCT